MPVRHQLPVPREIFERRVLEHHHVTFDVIEDRGLEYEEGAIDPTLRRLGLLLEGRHLVALEAHVAVARRGPNGGNRREFAVRTMERDELADIDVANPVAPRQHEGTCTEVGFQPFDATPGQGFVAGIDEVDGPGGVVPVVSDNRFRLPDIDCQIAGKRAVFGKISFNILAFVAKRNGKFMKAIMRIHHHDMPKYRAATDLDHRLRAN